MTSQIHNAKSIASVSAYLTLTDVIAVYTRVIVNRYFLATLLEFRLFRHVTSILALLLVIIQISIFCCSGMRRRIQIQPVGGRLTTTDTNLSLNVVGTDATSVARKVS